MEDQQLLYELTKKNTENVFLMMTTKNIFSVREDLFEYCTVIRKCSDIVPLSLHNHDMQLYTLYKSNLHNSYKSSIEEILQFHLVNQPLTNDQITRIRDILSNLLVSNINMKTIFDFVLTKYEMSYSLLSLINKYEYETSRSSKYILHMEAFFMELFENVMRKKLTHFMHRKRRF